MSQDAIQNVRATQALRADNDTPVDDLKQGEFVLDELQSGDLEARLKGDGVVTPTDATKRLISLNPSKDPTLAAMADDDAALFGATLAMRHPRNTSCFRAVRNRTSLFLLARHSPSDNQSSRLPSPL